MAKKKKANKSQIIRDYKTSNPSAKPKEIADAVSKGGVTVSAQFVSTVLSNAKKSAGKRRGKPGRKPRGNFGTGAGNEFPPRTVAIFKAAGELLKLAGDKSLAKEVLDMVAALRG